MTEERLRKTAAGVSLVVTPCLILASWLLWPVAPKDGTTFAGDLSRYGDVRVAASIATGAAALTVGVVAVFALIHILREKRGLLGLVGGGLAIMGSVLFAAQVGIAIASREIVTSGIVRAGQDFVIQRTLDADLLMIVYVGGLMLTAGLLLLAANLLIARAVPWPIAALVGCFAVTQAAGYAFFNPPTLLAASILAFLAFVPIGVKILIEPEQQWEHPPTFIGFRVEDGHREMEAIPAMATAQSEPGRVTATTTRTKSAARTTGSARTGARGTNGRTKR